MLTTRPAVAALVLFGSMPALADIGPGGNRLITLDHLFTATNEADAHLGTSVAAGDFNGDGRDDVAMASPFATVGTTPSAG